MTIWLIDKSAMVHLASSPDASDWAGQIECGLVRITTVTRLEVRYSTGIAEVLTLLAGSGQHRDQDFDLIASVTGQPAEWLTAA